MDKGKVGEKSQFKIPIDPGVSKVKKKQKNQLITTTTTTNNTNLVKKKTIVVKKSAVDKDKDKKDISQDNGKTEPVVKKANKKIGIAAKTSNNKNKKSSYRRTYQKTKAKLRLLIEEQEVLKDNLTRKDDQLVEISRDIHFILDRLLLYQDKLFNTNTNSTTAGASESYKVKELISKNKLLKGETAPAAPNTSTNKLHQNAKDRQEKSNKVSNVSSFDTLTNNTNKPSTSNTNTKNKVGRLNKTKPNKPSSTISKVKAKCKQPKTSTTTSTSLPVTKVRKKSGKKMNENRVSSPTLSPSSSNPRKLPILSNSPSLPKSMNAIKCTVPLPISRPSSPSRITLGSGFYQMSNSLEDGEEGCSPPPMLKSKKHFSFDNLQDNENEFCNGSLNNFMSSSLRESQIENELDPHGSFESSETSSEPFVTCSASLDSTRVKSQLSYCIPTDIDQDMIPDKPPDTLPDDIFSET